MGCGGTHVVRARIFLYAVTAGLSAFLLFTLELMVGRMLLPRFEIGRAHV